MTDPTVARLADVEVRDPRGAVVRLGSLWAERPVLLVMIRHFGCMFCKEQVGEMLRYADRVHGAGGEIVVLGCGAPEHAAWFVEDYHVTVPVLTDPDLASQRIVGAKVLRVPDPRIFVRAIAALRKGYRQTRRMGPSAQLGGVFVITPAGEMPFRYLSRYAGDHPEPEVAVRALEAAARTAVAAS